MKVKQLVSQFNWRFMLVRILVNAFVLALTVTILPHMRFVNGTLLNLLFMALVLGVLNALIKPIVQALTMSFFFATYGLVTVVVNALILLILQWLFPDRLVFDSLLWLLVAGVVVGLLSSFLETLLGLTLPITESQSPVVRRQLEKQAHVVGWPESREKALPAEEAIPDLQLPEPVAGRAVKPLKAPIEIQAEEPPADPDAEKALPGPQEEEADPGPPTPGDLAPDGETSESVPTTEPLAPEGEADENPLSQKADPDISERPPEAMPGHSAEDVPVPPTATDAPVSPDEEERS